jgi:hypothetical protein
MGELLLLCGEGPIEDGPGDGGYQHGVKKRSVTTISVKKGYRKGENHGQGKKDIEESENIEDKGNLHKVVVS